MSILDLDDEEIIKQSIDCMARGVTIPLEIQLWLKEKGLLYQILNPIKGV